MVAATGRRGLRDAERIQLSHGGHNYVVLCDGVHCQCLHHDGASGGCGGQGAEVAV